MDKCLPARLMIKLKTPDTLKSELQGDHLIREQLYQAQTSFVLWRKGGIYSKIPIRLHLIDERDSLVLSKFFGIGFPVQFIC